MENEDKICSKGDVVVRIISGPRSEGFIGRMYEVTSGHGFTHANYAPGSAMPSERWRHTTEREKSAFLRDGIIDINLVGEVTNTYSVW